MYSPYNYPPNVVYSLPLQLQLYGDTGSISHALFLIPRHPTVHDVNYVWLGEATQKPTLALFLTCPTLLLSIIF